MRKAWLAMAGAVTLAVALIPSVAVASLTTFTLQAPVTVSGPSPFAGCTSGASPNGVNYPDTEVEPVVAVNPTDPNNNIGASQQDRWSDGAAKGLVAARSTDGGATWTRNYAEFSTCSDVPSTAYSPPFNRATDPWVSFDSAGRAYQISLGIDTPPGPLSGVEVSTSTNGGATWNVPVRVITDNDPVNFNDKESITGDWRPQIGAGKAYATWIRTDQPGWDNLSPVGAANAYSFRGLPMFAKTTDGGATWSTPVSMSNANLYMQGNQIVVQPDGTLVDIGAVLFRGSGAQPNPQQYFWAAMTSKDGGKTWGAPVKIAPLGTALLTNPDIPQPSSLNQTIRAGDYLPDVAVDHTTGALYMVFADDIGGGVNHVMLTRSTDGGKRWSTPVDVTKTNPQNHAFNGTVEVTADGTVGVLYYDLRGNTPAAGVPTDVWLTHSHDGGRTWTEEQHVYGPFDMENAPVARGWFLGDYQGMAAISNDLTLFFAVSTAADNSADVIAIRASRNP